MTIPNEHEQLRALEDRFRKRIAGWDRNSDKGRLTVPLGELRAVLSLLDQLAALHEENEGLRQREEIAHEMASTHLDRWGAAEQRAEAAEARVAKLEEVLRLCQSALASMVAPDAIKSTSVVHAFAQATEAEAKARAALSEEVGS